MLLNKLWYVNDVVSIIVKLMLISYIILFSYLILLFFRWVLDVEYIVF